MKKIIFTSLLITIFVLQAALLFSAESSSFEFGAGAPIEIQADSIEYYLERGEYVITGNARMKSEESTLTADTITIDIINNKANASGNASIITKNETIHADEFNLDLTTKFGTIIRGRIFVKGENFYITGDSLERVGENEYVVKNGTFTTCDGDVPAWKFSASYLDIEIDGYVFAKHPVFYVKDFPTLYLPAVIFPIKKTRQSGILFPGLGHSKSDGTIIKLPYYQVISDSMDATFTLDSRSKMGTGLDTEFRYVLSEGSEGEMDYYIMDEWAKDFDRWSFSYRHREDFSPSAYMKVDLATVGDRNHYLDLGDDADERNREKIESNVTFTKNFPKASIQVEHSYDKDLKYNEPLGDLSTTNMQFPKVTGQLYKTRIGASPLNYSGVLTFNNYIQKRFEDITYLKADPKLSADFTFGPYAVFTPYITGEHARFWMHEDPAEVGHESYNSYATGALLSSKVLRIFSPGDTLKIRHLLNPELEYEYIPKHDVYETRYALAGIRRQKNEVTLRLINRLTTRSSDEDGKYRYAEPLRLEISQPYDIYESKRELDPAIIGDENRPYKPLYVDADVLIGDYFTLTGELYHDHYKKDHIQKYNVAMELKDKREDSLTARYTYLKGLDDYLETDLNINLSRGVHAGQTTRYDFLDNKTLESTYRLRFVHQCWEMIITYSEELIQDATDPLNIVSYTDKTVFFYVSLKGVGA
jgi:LPS-assembly protein